ncbi:MAG: hypothetical protein IPF74_01335 [Rhodocyclaceae bacterium]|nr:hypothetical protein [Rhodocyclaceae bacterium]
MALIPLATFHHRFEALACRRHALRQVFLLLFEPGNTFAQRQVLLAQLLAKAHDLLDLGFESGQIDFHGRQVSLKTL